MATTHTEIYRPFRGTLREREVRCASVARAAIRTAAKRKLPLLLLLAPPWMAGVIFSFVVYARFAVEAGVTPDALGGASVGARMVAGFAEKLIQVREQIVYFHLAMSVFTLLVIAWYGAGQIADDRRLGAHLLYFSRPLTIFDYVVGKLLAIGWFGALAVLLPILVILTVASFSSPEWSFVKQEGGVIPRAILFATLWILIWSSIILALSSLFTRKVFVLVAAVSSFAVPGALGTLLSVLLRDRRWHMLSVQGNFLRVAGWLFDMPRIVGGWNVLASFAILAAVTALSWIVVVHRVRRMEAVG